MNKIPVPVIVIIILVAIVAVVWSLKRTTSGSSAPVPTGPPSAEAMQHMRDAGRTGVVGNRRPPGMGGAPGGMGATDAAPPGR